MSDDSYQFPKSGKVYVSPSLPGFGDNSRRVRIASKVTGVSDGFEYAKEHGEFVLRSKPDARTFGSEGEVGSCPGLVAVSTSDGFSLDRNRRSSQPARAANQSV